MATFAVRANISDLLKKFTKYSKDLQSQQDSNAQVDETAQQNAVGVEI